MTVMLRADGLTVNRKRVQRLMRVMGIAAWIGFSLYVRHFGTYDKTFGSLGAVVILLMWFYISAYVVCLGAELNAELERQTHRDSTIGPEKPIGERGAFVADNKLA